MFIVKLEDIPEEGLNLKWTEGRSSLSGYLETLSQIDFDFEKPLQAEARIQKIGPSVYIEGKVETRLRMHCVRCLKEFSFPLASDFDVTLHPSGEAASEEEAELEEKELDSNFFEAGEIHLSEIACEQIFLEIPYQPLCQEDCKGLCPTCGKDLNLSACGCEKEDLGKGFSALKKLKLNQS
jgi:uncharacterized protein